MISLLRVSMNPAVGDQLTEVLHSGYIGQGPKVEAFEAALKLYTGRTPVSVNAGTSALTMALRLAGVGYGDEVISTPMTCSATNIPILSVGASPVWADIDPRTGLIDPESVKALVQERSRKVKAIMAVDWGGQPADYDALMDHGIPVIEDAAHAFGAYYGSRRVGSIADYTAFSFQAIKHLTTGDGGALTVPTGQLKRAKDMRWFGLDREEKVGFRGEQDITEWGYKFHMNDINATIGLMNLEIVDDVLSAHRRNASYYDRRLDQRFTRTAPDYRHRGSWWLYTVLLASAAERDAFKVHMADQQVQVSQVHWRNDHQTVFGRPDRQLPGVDAFSSRMICLPVHPDVPTQDVVRAANAFFE